MPATERSHADHPVATTRQRRRRLLAHAAAFASAAALSTVVSLPSSSAAPNVQTGRYLSAGAADVTFTCGGADAGTQAILAGLGSGTFPLPARITSAAVDPSPSPTDTFDMAFTWDFTFDTALIATAQTVGVTSFDLSDAVEPVNVVSGATGGPVVGNPPAQTVQLGDGSVPVGYTDGPFTGSFTRTADVDTPIVFAPGTVTLTVVAQPLGVPLLITCAPDATTLSVSDQDGVAPSTTTTTRPPVVTTAAPTTTAVLATNNRQLPRTGSSNMLMVVLALGLIDLGYLSLTAGRRRQVASSR